MNNCKFVGENQRTVGKLSAKKIQLVASCDRLDCENQLRLFYPNKSGKSSNSNDAPLYPVLQKAETTVCVAG